MSKMSGVKLILILNNSDLYVMNGRQPTLNDLTSSEKD